MKLIQNPLLLVAWLVLLPRLPAQTVPTLINYQGQLSDSSGQPLATADYALSFSIYAQESGGTAVWGPQTFGQVPAVQGYFNVLLGPADAAGRSLAVAFTGPDRYIQVSVNGGPAIVPRQRVVSAPFALKAETAGEASKLGGFDWSVIFGPAGPSAGFISGQRLAPGSVTTTQLDPNVRAQLDPFKISFPALESIRDRAAVAYTRDNVNQASVISASAGSEARSGFLGFATRAANAGQPVTAQQYGPLDGFSNLAAGRSYYLGTGQGEITASYPTGIQVYVGHALSEAVLFVDPFGISKSWSLAGNYWGDRSDGDFVTSGNFNIPSVEDQDVVVKQYSNLVINEGNTVTTATRCRGLVIYVDGNARIDGTLTMTARGANADPALPNSIPENGIRLVRRKAGGTQTIEASDLGGAGAGGVGALWRKVEASQPGTKGNGVIYTIARNGGTGGPGGAALLANAGRSVPDGTGGGGAGSRDPNSSEARGGSGSAGTCYSGGSGGGAAAGDLVAQGGSPNGGPGGRNTPYQERADGHPACGGGAGNPGGIGVPNGQSGTGGLLILCVKGTLSFGPNGSITANGMNGGGAFAASGGSSGGGRIIVLYGTSLSPVNPNIKAAGGLALPGGGIPGSKGGAGGDGAVTIDRIDP